MKQWTTTEDFIANGKIPSSAQVGFIVQTEGYSSKGDGGGAQWKFTGVTGQTASQSPAQLVDALLTDANGNQYELVISESINADALGDIQAALNRAGRSSRGQFVSLGNKDYTVSEPLDVPANCSLVGQGKVGSRIYGDHLTGEVVRVKGRNTSIKSILVWATQNRIDNGDSTCYGIRLEADDVPEGVDTRMQQCNLEDVEVQAQPSHGVVMIGPALDGTTLTRVKSWLNKGHGVVFDRGVITGRVNLPTVGIPGLTTLKNCNLQSNGGHGLACGSPTDNFSTPSLRVETINCEVGENCSDAAQRYSLDQIWLRGANHWVDTTVVTGGVGTSAVFCAGRNIHVKNLRAIGQTYSVHVGNYPELTTEGVYIEGINVLSGTQNFAVKVDSDARGVYINNKGMSGITKLVENRTPGLVIESSQQTVYKDADQSVINSTSYVDDSELIFPLDENEKIAFEFNVLYEGGSGIDIRTTVTGPAGSAINIWPNNSIKVGSSDTVDIQSSLAGGSNLIFGSIDTGVRAATISGVCTNSSTAGNLTFRFAQLTLSAGSSITVKAGSNLLVKRIIE